MKSEIKCIECGSRYFYKVEIYSEDTYTDEYGIDSTDRKELEVKIISGKGYLGFNYGTIFTYSCENCHRVVNYTVEKHVVTMDEYKERKDI